MLADTVDIENVDGTHTFSMNADTGGGIYPFVPLRLFDVTKDDRSDATRAKMQQSGIWPTRSYEGSMSMHIEGAMFSDTPGGYWNARQDLLIAVFGVPGANITEYYRGTLYVTPSGYNERLGAVFGPATVSAPIEANMIGSEILITLISFDPWFIGEDTGNKYWWS